MKYLLLNITLFLFVLPVSVISQESKLFKKKLNSYNSSLQPHGQWIYYLEQDSTVVHSKGRYKNGIPVGKWMLYHTNGVPHVKTRYIRQKAREKRFYSDGNIEKKGWSYLKLDDPSMLHYYWEGKWRIYNEHGKLQKIVLYHEGESVKIISEKHQEQKN